MGSHFGGQILIWKCILGSPAFSGGSAGLDVIIDFSHLIWVHIWATSAFRYSHLVATIAPPPPPCYNHQSRASSGSAVGHHCHWIMATEAFPGYFSVKKPFWTRYHWNQFYGIKKVIHSHSPSGLPFRGCSLMLAASLLSLDIIGKGVQGSSKRGAVESIFAKHQKNKGEQKSKFGRRQKCPLF